MTFNHLNRRLHLYLALILLPWSVMYGVSAIPFTRNSFFNDLYEDGVPQYTTRFEGAYDRPVPESWRAEDLRPFAREVIADMGLEVKSAFGAYRPNKREIIVFVYTFWENTRMVYTIEAQHIKVEDRRFRWDQFMTGLHGRGGFQQDGFLNTFWSVIVDLVCLGFILWSLSGIYMWWQLKGTRIWGLVALGGGCLSFLVFLVNLYSNLTRVPTKIQERSAWTYQ